MALSAAEPTTRRRGGRRPVTGSEAMRTSNIMFPTRQWDELARLADEDDATISSIVRAAVSDWIKRREGQR